jgi:DNA polymerase-3 subunit alpha
MGKKKPEEMERHKKIFCEGAEKNGFNGQKASELFDLMAMFAEYGFNKSHAVAYAVIAYQTAFLKTYFPSYFFSALLGSEMGNTDKITSYIQDAKENGIEILPPDINESLWSFNVIAKKNIRFGMGAVKNVGQGAVDALVKERVAKGYFKSMVDLTSRISPQAMNKRVYESLIKVGAFDQCDSFNRKTLLENLELIVSHGQKIQADQLSGQTSLFQDLVGAGLEDLNQMEIKEVDDFSEKENLANEMSLMGIYVSGHPLDKFKSMMKQISTVEIANIPEMIGEDKREVVLSGMFVEQKFLLTKKGDKMCFATLQDFSGKIECVIFPRVLEEAMSMMDPELPLAIQGTINLAESPRKFFPQKIHHLAEYGEQRVQAIKIELNEEEITFQQIESMKSALLGHRGQTPVYLIVENKNGKARIPLGQDFAVTPHAKLAHDLSLLFGKNVVQLVIEGKSYEAHS